MARSIPLNRADLQVSAPENEAVKQIFGVPEEENLGIVEALRRSRIKLVPTHHEPAPAFMAATVRRLSGHTGMCLSTRGPALNLTAGAAFAKLGRCRWPRSRAKKAFSVASRHSSNWSHSIIRRTCGSWVDELRAHASNHGEQS